MKIKINTDFLSINFEDMTAEQFERVIEVANKEIDKDIDKAYESEEDF